MSCRWPRSRNLRHRGFLNNKRLHPSRVTTLSSSRSFKCLCSRQWCSLTLRLHRNWKKKCRRTQIRKTSSWSYRASLVRTSTSRSNSQSQKSKMSCLRICRRHHHPFRTSICFLTVRTLLRVLPKSAINHNLSQINRCYRIPLRSTLINLIWNNPNSISRFPLIRPRLAATPCKLVTPQCSHPSTCTSSSSNSNPKWCTSRMLTEDTSHRLVATSGAKM